MTLSPRGIKQIIIFRTATIGLEKKKINRTPLLIFTCHMTLINTHILILG